MSSFSFSAPLRATGSVPVALRDGTAALRPLGPDEVEALDCVFEQLSAASRFDRYLSSVQRMSGTMRTRLAAVDGHEHVAWLGEVDGRPAAIGRMIRVGPGVAELAFEVVDAHQGRGLGKALLDALTTVGAVSGVQRLEATVLPTNHRSRRLLGTVGMTFRASQGLLEGRGPLRLLQPPVVDRPAVVRTAFDARCPSTSAATGPA